MDIIIVVASAARNGILPLLFQPCPHAYLSHAAILPECGELAGSSCSFFPAVLPHDEAVSTLLVDLVLCTCNEAYRKS
jgi:hypothetical protein